jgi:hypothetical protein
VGGDLRRLEELARLQLPLRQQLLGNLEAPAQPLEIFHAGGRLVAARGLRLRTDALAAAGLGLAVGAGLVRRWRGLHAALQLGARGGVRQQLVRLDHLPEDALEALAVDPRVLAKIAVRMELLREREVGALDGLGVGAALHTQQLVVGAIQPGLIRQNAALEILRDVEVGVDGRLDIELLFAPWGSTAHLDEMDGAGLDPAVEVVVHLLGRETADLPQHRPRRPAVDARDQETLGRCQHDVLGRPTGCELRNPLTLVVCVVAGMHVPSGRDGVPRRLDVSSAGRLKS